jgi:hypothetical protein
VHGGFGTDWVEATGSGFGEFGLFGNFGLWLALEIGAEIREGHGGMRKWVFTGCDDLVLMKVCEWGLNWLKGEVVVKGWLGLVFWPWWSVWVEGKGTMVKWGCHGWFEVAEVFVAVHGLAWICSEVWWNAAVKDGGLAVSWCRWGSCGRQGVAKVGITCNGQQSKH